MKKIILVMVILSITCGIVFAQENENVNFPKNNVSLHGSILGLAFNYERSFNRFFSISADTSINIFPGTFTLAAKGRVYPFGKAFYLEMGAGYGITAGYIGLVSEIFIRSITLGFIGLEDSIWLQGLVLTPALGWKIDFGEPGGFTLPISLGMDFFAGYRELDIPFDFVPNIRIGLGFSF